LSAPGEIYLARLVPAIDAIRSASESIRSERQRNSIKISLPPSFAAGWLVPRLPRFYARHRDIRIDLQSSSGRVDFNEMDADLAIERLSCEPRTCQTEHLVDVEVFPVCSAALLGNRDGLGTLAELTKFPLLATSDQSDLWPEWFHAVGIDDPPRALHFFDQFHLLYQAAASGLGVALGEDVTVKIYLDDCRLIRPFDVSVKLAKCYYLRARSTEAMPRSVSVFRKWLSAEAAAWRAKRQPAETPALAR
jgi:LysR family glycine cleavage system transcriptional activator